jgi:hypothetical protein
MGMAVWRHMSLLRLEIDLGESQLAGMACGSARQWQIFHFAR